MAQPCDMDLWVMKWRWAWPIFHGPVILPYILKTIWCMNIIVWDDQSVWHDIDLKINVGHCDIYFMVQWFCLIPWRLFDIWTSLFEIMSRYDLKTIWCMNIIVWDNESVWHNIWSQTNCRSLWPIFHGPVVLSYISKSIWCMSVIFSDNETVWPKLWPQSKYVNMTYISWSNDFA